MAYKLSIAEIVEKAGEFKSKEKKIEWLREYNSLPLRDILCLMYDKTKEFNIPQTEPPYTPSSYVDSQGMLYKEARKLGYFVKGFKGENVHPIKRETMFIQMLESVDPKDAKLLLQMVKQEPVKGLTAEVINEALGNIIPEKSDVKEEKVS